MKPHFQSRVAFLLIITSALLCVFPPSSPAQNEQPTIRFVRNPDPAPDFKLTTLGPVHPIFLYLLPAALVVMLYGTRAALLAVVTGVICADYFLYDPIFVFDIPGREEVSDVACFALLALLGIKCVHELFRPSEELSDKAVASENLFH